MIKFQEEMVEVESLMDLLHMRIRAASNIVETHENAILTLNRNVETMVARVQSRTTTTWHERATFVRFIVEEIDSTILDSPNVVNTRLDLALP